MADKIIVSCPNCSTKMSLPADHIGLEGHCFKCRTPFMMGVTEQPRSLPVQPPAVPREQGAPTPASRAHNLSMAGWICLFVGMGLLVLCPIFPFYSPFFLASFVLAIILLMTLLMPTLVAQRGCFVKLPDQLRLTTMTVGEGVSGTVF